MSDSVISVEGLGKSYFLGHNAKTERYTALRDVVARGARNLVRTTRDMLSGRQIVQGDEVEEFWALKDVSFDLKQGERLGIIGRNGAGKSTLLKLLSRITEPTEGQIRIKGRVASLLEVGTGFHPELTGRENIFLNGAILGMGRKEIQRKFDEIVDFAEVEQFLDTAVKRYSSGMYVRLAFAVAAHLEPEILIVDEVLAVGDAQFQKKCLGKMEEVGTDGRTVLFVSHNIAAISSLCNKAAVLRKGRLICFDKVDVGIEKYLQVTSGGNDGSSIASRKDRSGSGRLRLVDMSMLNDAHREQDIAVSGDSVVFRLNLHKNSPEPLNGVSVAIAISDTTGFISNLQSDLTDMLISVDSESTVIYCRLPKLGLGSGAYRLNVCVRAHRQIEDWLQDAFVLNVEDGDFFGTGRLPEINNGRVLFEQIWFRD